MPADPSPATSTGLAGRLRAAAARPLPLASLALLAAAFSLRAWHLPRRHFGPDEFQHLHATWAVARGLLPYRDFFEHHPPGLPWLLRPLFAAFDVEVEVGDAFALIFAARALMGVLALAVVALTFRLAAVWRGPAAGWTAAALVATIALFHDKTTETRPDVPATALVAGGWLLALAAAAPGGRRRTGAALASGALLGLALLFTPKTAFALPAAVAALLVHPRADAPRARLARLGWFGAGTIAPPLLAFAYFAARGAASPFLEGNVWVNLHWKGRLGPTGVLLDLVRQNPLLLPLAAVGAGGAAVDAARARPGAACGTLLLAGLAGLLAGLVLVPVVYRQYVLLFVPLLGVLAAGGLLAAAPRAFRARHAAAAALLVVGGAGLWPIARATARDNTRTLEDMRFIHRNVAPWETVLDGFTGWAVFRQSASYYHFLHGDLRQMVPAEEIAALEDGLRAGRLAPKLILFDRYLRALSPGISAFLEEHYAPVGRGRIRVRLYDNGTGRWDDTGVRRLAPDVRSNPFEPHVVVAEGWRRMEREGARSYRRCVGRCVLLVPIRTPRPFTAAVEARSGDGRAATLELRANGRAPRRAAVEGRWDSVRLDLPSAEVQPGFNRWVLSCRRAEAPCVLSVATLQLQAAPLARDAESTASTSSSSTGRKSR